MSYLRFLCGENRMDNPEELATQGKDKQSKKYNTEN
jgi:hypothetical protein